MLDTVILFIFKPGWRIRGEGENEELVFSSKRTIQRTSAMGENTKMQILSQDMIRRLRITSESLGSGEKVAAVDQYTQKLINSGYTREQVARSIINGIKGYEDMRRRRMKEGRKMRSTGAQSRYKRYQNKLIGKVTWFNWKKGGSNSQEERKIQRRGAGGAQLKRGFTTGRFSLSITQREGSWRVR